MPLLLSQLSFLLHNMVLIADVNNHIFALHTLFLQKLRSIFLRLVNVPLQSICCRLGLLQSICEGNSRTLFRHASLESLMVLSLSCHAERAVLLVRPRLAWLHMIVISQLFLLVIH